MGFNSGFKGLKNRGPLAYCFLVRFCVTFAVDWRLLNHFGYADLWLISMVSVCSGYESVTCEEKKAAAHGHALSASEHSSNKKAKVNLFVCLNTTLWRRIVLTVRGYDWSVVVGLFTGHFWWAYSRPGPCSNLSKGKVHPITGHEGAEVE